MQKNPFIPVMALSFVSATALLVLNLQPLFIGSAGRQFELNDVELGYFASWPLLASVLVFLTAPFWLYQFSLRALLFFGGAISVLALIAMSSVSAIVALTLCFALYVIGVSITQVPALVALGQMPDPESAFGVYVAASVVLAGALAFFIPAVVEPMFGFRGFLILIAITTAISILFIKPLSNKPLQAEEEGNIGPGGRVWTARVVVSLLGLAVFYLGIMAAWAFLERVGEQAGMEDGAALGLSFTIALLLGALGPILAAHFGERISAPVAITVTAIIFLGFILLLTIGPINRIKFMLALIAFNIAWNFGIPYLLAVTSKADITGRGFALAPAALAIGSAFGPAVGGNALSAFGPTGLFVTFGAVMALSFLAMLWVDTRATQQTSTNTV